MLSTSTSRLSTNTRIYCIGDIHGRIDLLSELLIQINQHNQRFSGRIVMIYLGDYIDRGDSSKEVIDLILNNERADIEYIYLRGNHEQIFLNFIEDKAFANFARPWLSFGGDATLKSYGVALPKKPNNLVEVIALRQHLLSKLPPRHYLFFAQTRLFYSLGSYFFVHAGVNPNYDLANQRPKDLLWIRDAFINSKQMFEKVIVHGHTVTESVALLPNRIGIDTGAYATDVLTCLVLQGNQYKLIQTTRNP